MPSQKSNKIICSVGVFAYNEVENISKLLNALLSQKLSKVEIGEIIVVSSASKDGTDEAVLAFAEKSNKIKLIAEKERNGKSAAINKFINASQNDILVIESADTIPAGNTIEKMVSAFADETIGMTGGKPTPENSPKNFVGYSVNLLWRLHHKMALISPKLGEMVAFRKIFTKIPAKSAVDEASIEAIIRKANLKLQYIPDAIIHNKGPENLGDFILQRRRIEAGHLWLQDTEKYEVASQSGSLLLRLTLTEITENPTKIFFLLGTMIIEIYSRFLGWFDYRIKKKNPFKWEIAKSTKKLEIK